MRKNRIESWLRKRQQKLMKAKQKQKYSSTSKREPFQGYTANDVHNHEVPPANLVIKSLPSSSEAEVIRYNRDRSIATKLWQMRSAKKNLTNIDVWQNKDYLHKCLMVAVKETLPIINEYREVETELYGIEYVEFTERDLPEHDSYSNGSVFFDIFDVIEVKQLFDSEYKRRNENQSYEDIRRENRDRNIASKFWKMRNAKKDLTNVDTWYDKEYLLDCIDEAFEETLPIINDYRKVESELYGIEYVEFTEWDLPEYGTYSDAVFYQAD